VETLIESNAMSLRAAVEMEDLRFGPPFLRNVCVCLSPPAFWERFAVNKYDAAIAEEVSMGR
jgi:hypothetical protein